MIGGGVLSGVVCALRFGGLTVGLCAGMLLATAGPASARQAAPADVSSPAGPGTASAGVLEEIRVALDSAPSLVLDRQHLRFYVRIVAPQFTWADYVREAKDWTRITRIVPPTSGPGPASVAGGGSGIDLLGIFRQVNDAYERRQTRQIRDRIDAELRALVATPAATP